MNDIKPPFPVLTSLTFRTTAITTETQAQTTTVRIPECTVASPSTFLFLTDDIAIIPYTTFTNFVALQTTTLATSMYVETTKRLRRRKILTTVLASPDISLPDVNLPDITILR